MTPQQERFLEHLGHDVEIAYYGDPEDPASVTVECLTCGAVVVEADRESDPVA